VEQLFGLYTPTRRPPPGDKRPGKTTGFHNTAVGNPNNLSGYSPITQTPDPESPI